MDIRRSMPVDPRAAAARKTIFDHFDREFGHKGLEECAKHFAKKSCNTCRGRGTLVFVDVGAKPTDKARLEFCGCMRKRINRQVEELIRSGKSYQGPKDPTKEPPPAPENVEVVDQDVILTKGSDGKLVEA